MKYSGNINIGIRNRSLSFGWDVDNHPNQDFLKEFLYHCKGIKPWRMLDFSECFSCLIFLMLLQMSSCVFPRKRLISSKYLIE